MDKFFPAAGELLSHRIVRRGKTIVSMFEYLNGNAEYDGREWTFTIKPAPRPARNLFTNP